MEKREKRKRRENPKEMNKWMKGKSEQNEVMKEKGKNVERKSETKKRTEQKQKMKVFGLRFLWENVKRERGLTRNSRKSSKIKGLVTHTFSKKKKNKKRENRKRRNEKWQKEKKNRRCLLQFVGKKHFSDTSKQESNK